MIEVYEVEENVDKNTGSASQSGRQQGDEYLGSPRYEAEGGNDEQHTRHAFAVIRFIPVLDGLRSLCGTMCIKSCGK